MNKTLIVNRDLRGEILTVERCIPAMRDILKAVSENKAKALGRTVIFHENGNMLANMPASDIAGGVTGAKVIIFPGKRTAEKGTSRGIIPLFSIEDGSLLAVVDALLITVARTAATSRVATDALANKDARKAAMLGCGKQGRAHAAAMLLVRDIKAVTMWDINPRAAQSACRQLKEEYPAVDFIPCDTAKEAVADADIICTTTPGRTTRPIIDRRWLKDGVHINAVGACSARGRELDADTVYDGAVFTDWNEAVKTDRGDILLAAREKGAGLPELTEIGLVLSGQKEGRQSEKEITVFESVGISVEDIAAAEFIYNYARDNDMGLYVEI